MSQKSDYYLTNLIKKIDVYHELLKPASSYRQYVNLGYSFNKDKLKSVSTIHFNVIKKQFGLADNNFLGIIAHFLNFASTCHDHDYYEVNYLPRGEILNVIEGKPVLMTTKSLIIIPPGIKHLIKPYRKAKNQLLINLLIEPSFFKIFNNLQFGRKSLYLQLSSKKINYIFYQDRVGVTKLVDHMILEYYSEKQKMTPAIFGELLQIFYYIEKSVVSHRLPVSKDLLIQKITTEILADPADISLKKLADDLNYSQSYISRHFKAIMGQSVGEYIAGARINLAQNLLLKSNQNIDEVAHEVGYQSASNFYTVFKKKTHLTPHEYRKLAE